MHANYIISFVLNFMEKPTLIEVKSEPISLPEFSVGLPIDSLNGSEWVSSLQWMYSKFTSIGISFTIEHTIQSGWYITICLTKSILFDGLDRWAHFDKLKTGKWFRKPMPPVDKHVPEYNPTCNLDHYCISLLWPLSWLA